MARITRSDSFSQFIRPLLLYLLGPEKHIAEQTIKFRKL